VFFGTHKTTLNMNNFKTIKTTEYVLDINNYNFYKDYNFLKTRIIIIPYYLTFILLKKGVV